MDVLLSPHKEINMNARDVVIGNTYHNLTILQDMGIGKNYAHLFLTRCQCGKEKIYPASSIGKTKSCGCARKQKRTGAHTKDYTGKHFGKLTVIQLKGYDKKYNAIWTCKCDCGNLRDVHVSSLRSGSAIDCKECGKVRAKSYTKDKHWRWMGGSTKPRRHGDRQEENWSKRVRQKFNYQCAICEQSDELAAHHLYSWNTHPHLRYIDINGICLCQECHHNFHREWGYGYNTPQQFLQWLKDIKCQIAVTFEEVILNGLLSIN